jgi:hypothetical protein
VALNLIILENFDSQLTVHEQVAADAAKLAALANATVADPQPRPAVRAEMPVQQNTNHANQPPNKTNIIIAKQ